MKGSAADNDRIIQSGLTVNFFWALVAVTGLPVSVVAKLSIDTITGSLFTVTRFASAIRWISCTVVHLDSFNGQATNLFFIDASIKTG
jgi:hypothetical protein